MTLASAKRQNERRRSSFGKVQSGLFKDVEELSILGSLQGFISAPNGHVQVGL